jgi:hypothetical protein
LGSWGEISGTCEAAFFRVVGLAGFEDAVDLVEEFAHDGDDDLFGFLAVFEEPVGEGFEEGIEDAGGHGGHEEAASEVDGTDLGTKRSFLDRSERDVPEGAGRED